MSTKLIALYKQPADQAAFEEAYFNTHLPLVAKLPGLQKTVITRFTRTLMGETFILMAEMFFSDAAALKNAMRSPEMSAAGDNLRSFAEGLVTMAFGEDERSAVNPPAGTTFPAQAS